MSAQFSFAYQSLHKTHLKTNSERRPFTECGANAVSFASVNLSAAWIQCHVIACGYSVPMAQPEVGKPTCHCLGFDRAAGIVWGLIGGLFGERCAPYRHFILSPFGQKSWTRILQWYHSMTEHLWGQRELYCNMNALDIHSFSPLKKQAVFGCRSTFYSNTVLF